MTIPRSQEAEETALAPGSKPCRSRVPAAYASIFAPAGKRTCWWATFRCPRCADSHFARARSAEDIVGPRRAGCGRRIVLIAARTYRSRRRVA